MIHQPYHHWRDLLALGVVWFGLVVLMVVAPSHAWWARGLAALLPMWLVAFRPPAVVHDDDGITLTALWGGQWSLAWSELEFLHVVPSTGPIPTGMDAHAVGRELVEEMGLWTLTLVLPEGQQVPSHRWYFGRWTGRLASGETAVELTLASERSWARHEEVVALLATRVRLDLICYE